MLPHHLLESNQVNQEDKQPLLNLKLLQEVSHVWIVHRDLRHHSNDFLPPLADFAHRIVIAYRLGGSQEAVKAIHAEDMDIKKKSVAYAFLLSMDKASSEQWKYSDMEKDYATHLRTYTEALLSSQGEVYHQTLKELLTAAGSTKLLGD